MGKAAKDKGSSTDLPPQEKLRSLTKELLASDKYNTAGHALPHEESQRLIHELQVYQIELEMQNEELRQARDQRQKMEALLGKYSDLYELAPVGYFNIDNEGILRAVNLTGAGFLGVERSLLINSRLDSFISDETRPGFRAFLVKVFASEARETCDIVFEREGHPPIYVSVEAIVSASSKECRAVIVDTTERKKITQSLAENEARLRTLVQTIPDLIWLKNEDGVYQLCNTMFERFFGARESDIIGKTDYDFVDRELADFFREYDRKAMAAGKPSSNEEWITFADDGHHALLETIKTPMFDSEGKLVGVLGVARDITERKQSEEKLRKLSLAIEQSPVSVVITDLEGNIEFVNTKFTQITGYSFKDVRGRNPRILKSGMTTPEEYRKLWSTIQTGNVWQGEFHNRKKDGELFIEYATISPIKNNEGVITHFVAIKEDVTERKALEAQLSQAQKMEAIGQLAGGVAHDFNNILTAIIGFGTLLKMNMGTDDPQREYADQILDAADRAANLTKSLLTFSRKQIFNPQPANLNKIIEEAEKFLNRVIGEDIDISANFHQEKLVINADSSQLGQVLMNLATNARDAMPHGGILSIDTESVRMDSEFVMAHGYGTQGDYALITVTDTGMGMDETTRKRLFEPFFTTKEIGKGTGLGLAIVYGIIKQHKGYINVYSEKGIGTTFNIYLPLIEVALDEHGTGVEEITEMGVETILVADDDESVQCLLNKILSQSGYTVIRATDGVDALHKFGENKDIISLVLMDLIMPHMNGKEALEEIRKIRPDIKSIFISGYTADIIVNRGIINEGLEYVTKPMRPSALLKKVREVLDKTSGGSE